MNRRLWLLGLCGLAVSAQLTGLLGWAQTSLDTRLSDLYPSGASQPQAEVTRAELAALVVKVFDIDKRVPSDQAPIELKDVPTTHWAYAPIEVVLRTQVMQGYAEGLFHPNQKVTRAEGLAIFSQAYGVFQWTGHSVQRILAKYPDGKQVPGWAQKAMATGLQEGFVNVDPHKHINPLKPLTRADLNYALSAYLQKQDVPHIPN